MSSKKPAFPYGGKERGEGLVQVRALLGDELLGAVPAGEPVILCGDFNLSPGRAAYRLLASRLRDARGACSGFPNV